MRVAHWEHEFGSAVVSSVQLLREEELSLQWVRSEWPTYGTNLSNRGSVYYNTKGSSSKVVPALLDTDPWLRCVRAEPEQPREGVVELWGVCPALRAPRPPFPERSRRRCGRGEAAQERLHCTLGGFRNKGGGL